MPEVRTVGLEGVLGEQVCQACVRRCGGPGCSCRLSYAEWTNGAWHHVINKVAVVNGTDSWTFHDKANVKAWAGDRKVGTTALLNIKSAW